MQNTQPFVPNERANQSTLMHFAATLLTGIATLKPSTSALTLNTLQAFAHKLLIAKNRFDSD